MAEAEKTAGAKLVDSVALTLFARVAMIVATSLILPRPTGDHPMKLEPQILREAGALRGKLGRMLLAFGIVIVLAASAIAGAVLVVVVLSGLGIL